MGTAANIPGWGQIRREALDRDGWRCRNCGKAGRLEVHHVLKLRDGGTNDLANLRSLCVGCHLAEHRKPVPPQAREWAALVEELE